MGRQTRRFFSIYRNLLKNITMAHSECTTKHENKASYKTDYFVLDLIIFLSDD